MEQQRADAHSADTPRPVAFVVGLDSVLLLVLAYGVVRFLRYRLRLRQEVQISKLERQKTEELNHAKLQFFTNVTHELMTPLTIILTSLQNLNNGTGDNQTLYGVMSANATRLMNSGKSRAGI